MTSASGTARSATAPQAVRVDGPRLLERLARLRAIGATADGGVTREAFGPLDVEARTLVATWMAAAGLEPRVDAAGNLVGRRSGVHARQLASGSHLDTVVEGGWLDGAYGVVAAVEVAAALADAGVALDHGYAAVAFANEEGARGTQGMSGSRALVGPLEEGELGALDDDGRSLRDRLADAGGDGDRIVEARWDAATVAAFLELHIEQGPVLASQGSRLGVVTAITGRQAFDVEVRGRPNHAGTTPMELRHDALAAAAEVVLAIEALPSDGAVRVATCGFVDVRPNVRNVIPGLVALSAELRAEDARGLDAAMATVDCRVAEIGARRGVAVSVRWGQRVAPTATDPRLLQLARAVASASGGPWTELPSGAGHDAQILGQVVPIAMLFVPSRGGVSHAPDEDTDPAELVAGAQALVDLVLAVDRDEPPAEAAR